MMREIVEGIVAALESVGGLFIHIDGGFFILACALLIVIGVAGSAIAVLHSRVSYGSARAAGAGYGLAIVVATLWAGLLGTVHPQSQVTAENLRAGGGVLAVGLILVVVWFIWGTMRLNRVSREVHAKEAQGDSRS